MSLALGTVELKTIPRVVAILDEPVPFAAVSELEQEGADLFEIRIDCFPVPFPEIIKYLVEVRKHVSAPFIGTIRQTDANRHERLSMFKEILPCVESVDIEIDADINQQVISMAQDKVKIISEHDFEKTPNDNALQALVYTAKRQGADIVKIAAMAQRREDVTRLLRFTEDCRDNLVSIAMGEEGAVSRVIAPLFGSLFTYAYVTRPVAPGQLSLEETVAELKRYFPCLKS
ncbi:MAG: type I 3-dehydroquinate dehydratase [Chitinivibrionales bacterium]|nr:type I 3-dehydroquinate dehydratase [Chitinivibrionales bacterium]